MIDGIKIHNKIPFLETFVNSTGIELTVSVDPTTGQVAGRPQKNNSRCITYTYTGKFEHYIIKVLETVQIADGISNRTTCNLIVRGSLHKNHFKGQNYQQFTFAQQREEIGHLCDSLSIMPEEFKIQNLEIGENIPFSAYPFVDSELLLHSTIAFVRYDADRNGIVLGRYAKHSQFSIKCYDKSKQFDLDHPLMRIEVRCIKMQYLKRYGIEHMMDLMDLQKMKRLNEVLIKAWDQVTICDPTIAPAELPISLKDKHLLNNGMNRDFWERSLAKDRKCFYRDRARFKKLTGQFGSLDSHARIKALLLRTQEDSLYDGTFLPCVSTVPIQAREDILTIKIKDRSITKGPYTNVGKKKNDTDTSEDLSTNQSEKEDVIACKDDIQDLPLNDTPETGGDPYVSEVLQPTVQLAPTSDQVYLERPEVADLPINQIANTTTVMADVKPVEYPQANMNIGMSEDTDAERVVTDHQAGGTADLAVVDTEEILHSRFVGMEATIGRIDGIACAGQQTDEGLATLRKERKSLLKKLCSRLMQFIRQRLKR